MVWSRGLGEFARNAHYHRQLRTCGTHKCIAIGGRQCFTSQRFVGGIVD
jgi:hypothetical protein